MNPDSEIDNKEDNKEEDKQKIEELQQQAKIKQKAFNDYFMTLDRKSRRKLTKKFRENLSFKEQSELSKATLTLSREIHEKKTKNNKVKIARQEKKY